MRKRLGDFGEMAARGYLARHGFVELARNWRCRGGEIDLVMRDGPTLVFVEVRTSRASDGRAAESVGRGKQQRLIGLAYTYLDHHALALDSNWRIDVVAVELGPRGRIERIDHVRNAVEEQ